MRGLFECCFVGRKARHHSCEKSNAFRCTCLLRPYRAFFYCSSLLAPPRLSIFHNNLVGALERARSSSRTKRGSDSGGNSSQLRTVHWSLVVCSCAGHRSSKFALHNLRCGFLLLAFEGMFTLKVMYAAWLLCASFWLKQAWKVQCGMMRDAASQSFWPGYFFPRLCPLRHART